MIQSFNKNYQVLRINSRKYYLTEENAKQRQIEFENFFDDHCNYFCEKKNPILSMF